MNYSKIIQLAVQCQSKRDEITALYRTVGGNTRFSDETKEILYKVIEENERELVGLENKLRKQIK